MRHEAKKVDFLLDQAAAQIRAAQPAETQVQRAAARVWERLERDTPRVAVEAAEVGEIRGCADYQALLPAFLAGELPEARRILVDDHTRSCVPCRKALKTLRAGEPAWGAASMPQPRPAARPLTRHPFARWGLAAAATIAGLSIGYLALRDVSFSSGPSATVQTAAEGSLFRVDRTAYLPIVAGEAIREGDHVRTGRTGGAVLELADGSLIELRERTELAIDEARRGTTLELVRGNVIVQAAKQRGRHLYVSTDDCLVSVVGTIFSVNHGTKGSRVSVIEGEVRVDFSGEEATLLPGDQAVTTAALATVPIAEEIAWSRDVDRYVAMLREIQGLRRDLETQVPHPGLRFSSRLVDLLPADTVFLGAVPNLSQTITESFRVIRDRVDSSPILTEWWRSHQGNEQFGAEAQEVIDKIDRFGANLGAELVVAAVLGGEDGVEGPLVLADVTNAAELRRLIEQEIAQHQEHGGEVIFLDDPNAPVTTGEDTLLIWLTDDLLVASPHPGQIRQVAAVVAGASNPFVGSNFHTQIAHLYEEGAGILAAADLERVVTARPTEPEGEHGVHETLARLGFENVEHLMLEQKRVGEKTDHRAVLTFRDARHGVASWLAAPAPMGSLDFLSPETKFFAAFVVKDPTALLDDLQGLMGDDAAEFAARLLELEQRYGLDLRADLAATLGGELTLAVDGPLLPQPAFKLVLEVYDPARFQWTVEQAVAEINRHLQAEGKEPIELRREEVGGRTVFTLPAGIGEVCYTFADGYLVAAPSKALLDQALRFHDAGHSIVNSTRFTNLLPTDRRPNFSALAYYDVGELLQPIAERLAQGNQISDEQQQALTQLQGDTSPVLAYAYGETDRILFAATSSTDFLSSGLLGLVGLNDPAGLGQLLSEAAPAPAGASQEPGV